MKPTVLWAAAALTLIVSPLVAQQHQHQAPAAQPAKAGSMENCPGMMAGPVPAQVLQHRGHLALTAAQVATLEDLSRAMAALMPKMHDAMQARSEISNLLSAPNPDLAEYERRLRAAGEQMIQAHVGVASVAVRTRGVLTAEQLKQFKSMSSDESMTSCPMMMKTATGPAAGAATHKH